MPWTSYLHKAVYSRWYLFSNCLILFMDKVFEALQITYGHMSENPRGHISITQHLRSKVHLKILDITFSNDWYNEVSQNNSCDWIKTEYLKYQGSLAFDYIWNTFIQAIITNPIALILNVALNRHSNMHLSRK